MSMQYCFFCDKSIDTDYQPDHFNDAGKCISPTVGIDYFGREFYVSEVPAYNLDCKCQHCGTLLRAEDTAITDEGYPNHRDWFCSYDCISETIDQWNYQADRAMDREKVERRTGNHWTQRASDKAQLDRFK